MSFLLKYHDISSHYDYYQIDLDDGRTFVAVLHEFIEGEFNWTCLREDHPERDGVTSGFAIFSSNPESNWSTSPFELKGESEGSSVESVVREIEDQLSRLPYEETHPLPPIEMTPHVKRMGELMKAYIGARRKGAVEEAKVLQDAMADEWRDVAQMRREESASNG